MKATMHPDPPAAPPRDMDFVEAAAAVLSASPAPLTAKQIRAALPVPWRGVALAHLSELLHRQAAAQVLVLYPKYRSPHDRFWDRPVRSHIEDLILTALGDGPLPRSALRQRLPEYAKILADSVLEEQLAKGRWHRHPPPPGKKRPLIGLAPPDPRVYVRPEFDKLLLRCGRLGFRPALVREALFDLLREAEWTSESPSPTEEGALATI